MIAFVWEVDSFAVGNVLRSLVTYIFPYSYLNIAYFLKF